MVFPEDFSKKNNTFTLLQRNTDFQKSFFGSDDFFHFLTNRKLIFFISAIYKPFFRDSLYEQCRSYYNPGIETMDRDSLDSLIDERVRYTVRFAHEHSPFYRHWGRRTSTRGISGAHEDLLRLPIVPRTIRENQPPTTPEFRFLSTLPGTSSRSRRRAGRAGHPRVSSSRGMTGRGMQGNMPGVLCRRGSVLGPGGRVCLVRHERGCEHHDSCSRKIGMTIIPFGRCDFASRAITAYRPTAIVGSVFDFSARAPAGAGRHTAG